MHSLGSGFRANVRFTLGLGVLAILLVGPACGGGGGASAPLVPPLKIVHTALPQSLSGETVDHAIALSGGCGGPYLLEVIDGALPPGIAADNQEGRHHLAGTLLEAGSFQFTLQVTDVGCSPFLSTTAAFAWDVGVGPLKIVGADPALIPVEDYDEPRKYADVDALRPTVYNDFTAIDLIVAGGVPPYTCAVVDDPDDPDDGGLPFGTALPPNSRSIVGTPNEVAEGGRPFRLTIQVEDASGGATIRKLQWQITTPQLVIASQQLPDGKTGEAYLAAIEIADGVPPFRYELIDDQPTVPDDEIVYDAPNPPTFDSASGFTVSTTGEASNRIGPGGGSALGYPAVDDDGPAYGPYPSEGIYLEDEGTEAGALRGVPRRRGSFSMYVHAHSVLVPNAQGQHAFAAVSMAVEPSEPPTPGTADFAIDPSFTVEGQQLPAPLYASLPEFEVGKSYNPDAATHDEDGLQLLAEGGVPADGFIDAPHASQRTQDPNETEGTYLWTADWDPDDLGLSDPPPGVEMSPSVLPDLSDGSVLVADPSQLVRQKRAVAAFTCRDHQLPESARNETEARFGYAVGPDVVIITHSTQSLSATRNHYSDGNRHAWNDTRMRIQRFESFSSEATRQPLDATDLAAGHTVPATAGLSGAANPLGALLSGATGGDPDLDLLRCTINATGWWDDLHGLNPRGARPYQHADANRGYQYYSQYGMSYSRNGNWQPSCSAVDLPDAEGVVADASQGIYADGGRCYHFESGKRFGVFIVRPDAKIYVPFAMEKGSDAGGFGDGLLEARSTGGQNSALRTVQMTVSPDGRFAAMKLKRTPTDLYEHAVDGQIVIFSLTGEKPFGGKTWKIVGSGSYATGAGHRILHASSLALTNTHLYFLIGSRSAYSTSTSYTPLYYQSWSGHYLMRYAIQGTVTAASLLPSSDPQWTQAANVPMQTTFHHHGPHPYSYGLVESSSTYGRWPYHRYWSEDGMNFNEHGQAPTPFRVSRDGHAVAFLAGSDYYGTYGTMVYSNYGWVDYDGTGARRITSNRRHASMGSGRGYSLMTGPSEYGMWGRYNGPTTGLEISDDGLQVAFVYNTNPGSVASNYSATSSSHPWMRYREDVVLCRTTAQDKWATLGDTKIEEVTKSTFGGSHRWRFGSLVFTADASGLVFWGGAPVYYSNSTSTSYNQSYWFAGSYYVHDVNTTNTVSQILATSDGGSPDGYKTYTKAQPFSPGSTSGLNNRFGAVAPAGGFLSRNRQFFYVVAYGALSSSDGTGCQLVGFNITGVQPGKVNGHDNARGFRLKNWPFRRGFIGAYYYRPGYAWYSSYVYAPAKNQGAGRQVMAKDAGWVFWGSGYQYSGPSQSSSSSYGGPVFATYYRGAYGYGGVGVYGFNADLGGAVAQLDAPGFSSPTTSLQESLHFLEVSRNGTRVAYVSSMHATYSLYDKERVSQVHNIDFGTPDGSMHGSFNRAVHASRIESGTGRAGEAVAVVPGNRDIYYAFKAGASNEVQMEMVRARLDPATQTWSLKRHTGVSGRMHVLFGGR